MSDCSKNAPNWQVVPLDFLQKAFGFHGHSRARYIAANGSRKHPVSPPRLTQNAHVMRRGLPNLDRNRNRSLSQQCLYACSDHYGTKGGHGSGKSSIQSGQTGRWSHVVGHLACHFNIQSSLSPMALAEKSSMLALTNLPCRS